MVLSHLMKAAGYRFRVAHIDHNTREGESQRDADFVSSYFKKLNIQVHHHSFQFSGQGNFHDEAHKARYAFFQSLDSDIILTAHHQDDHTETILINVLNGRSTDGIPAINGKFIRPLLPYTKSQILDYASKHKIPYVEDSSNIKNDYLRNYIRNSFLLAVRDYKIETKLANLSSRIADEKDLLLNLIDAAFHIESKAGRHIIKKSQLRTKSPLFLLLSLRTYGVNRTQVVNLLDAIDKTGTVISTQNYKLLIDREKVIIEPHSVQTLENDFRFNLEDLPLEYKHHDKLIEIKSVYLSIHLYTRNL